MEKSLKLYKGDKLHPFPNESEHIILADFKYNAQRMAACPTITASFMFDRCLDNEWSEEVYATFNEEKYYIKSVPTSSKDNKTFMYKHELTLYSERFILDNTYFYDVVKTAHENHDGGFDIVANSAEVVVKCNLVEFVNRINDSLEYSKLDYKIDLTDIDIYKDTDPKDISLSKVFIGTALQEIYKQWNVPYYFRGKSIIIGEGELIEDTPLEYGAENNLLSIKKNNANYKIINRCSGYGSERNIPFYYPNWSQKGVIDAIKLETNKIVKQENIHIMDMDRFDKFVPLNGIVTYLENSTTNPMWNQDMSGYNLYGSTMLAYHPNYKKDAKLSFNNVKGKGYVHVTFHVKQDEMFTIGDKKKNIKWIGDIENLYKHIETSLDFNNSYVKYGDKKLEVSVSISNQSFEHTCTPQNDKKTLLTFNLTRKYDVTLSFATVVGGTHDIYIKPNITINDDITNRVAMGKIGKKNYESHMPTDEHFYFYCTKFGINYKDDDAHKGWYINGTKLINLNEVGLAIDGTPDMTWNGEGLKQVKIAWITPSKTLMPSLYRDSWGKEMFYNSINYDEDTKPEQPIYRNPDDGKYYTFENVWNVSNQREHIQGFEDLYPTIKGVKNSQDQRIDQILDIAFDEHDNNDIDEEGNFLHPYFYIKIAQTSFVGDNEEYTFNIFNQKLVGQDMEMAITSGDCNACVFKIQVIKKPSTTNPTYEDVFNPVQVDEQGNIVKGDWEQKTQGANIPSQQDSSTNSIWLVVLKDNATFGEGQTYPKNPTIVPKQGDSFVLLNIKPPKRYILDAEKRLDEAIIRYMWENNSDKFKFNINFSRIFLQDNPSFTKRLNENVRLIVSYNGLNYKLYANNFTYEVKAKEVLPKITIGVVDKITVNRSVTQTISNGIMRDVMGIVNDSTNVDVLSKFFIRKDKDDATEHKLDVKDTLTAKNGVVTNKVYTNDISSQAYNGDSISDGGFRIMQDEDGESTMTIDNLIVRKKLQATEFVIQQIQFQGGIVWQTAAGMTCSAFQDMPNVYRCYFDTKEGTISNQFQVNDLARCQRIGYAPKYYWRKVVAIGKNYIDLSNVEGEFEQYSDVPSEGDIIVQLGNTTDVARQAAIEMNTVGEQAPSFKMYSGINSFSLLLKDVTGIVYDQELLKPILYSYGDMFFGARPKITQDGVEEESDTYIKYDSATQQMDIKANVTIKGMNEDINDVLNNLDKNITDTQNKVDNIKVGGTNLYDHSKGDNDLPRLTTNNIVQVGEESQISHKSVSTDTFGNNVTFNGHNTLELKYISTNFGGGFAWIQFGKYKRNDNKMNKSDYVFSMWVYIPSEIKDYDGIKKNNVKTNIFYVWGWNGDNSVNYGNFKPRKNLIDQYDTWCKVEVPMKYVPIDDDNKDWCAIRIGIQYYDTEDYHYMQNATMYISDLKFEEGNIATDWSPSLKDNIRAEHNRLVDTYKLNIIALDGQNQVSINFTPTIALKPNTDYVFSVEKTIKKKGSSNVFTIGFRHQGQPNDYLQKDITISDKSQYAVITLPNETLPTDYLKIYAGKSGFTQNTEIDLYQFKLAEGNVYTGWSAASPEEYDSLRLISGAIEDGSTEVNGGMVMTNVLMLKDMQNNVQAGMSGITKYNDVEDNVLLWGGGNYTQSQQAENGVINLPILLTKKGYGSNIGVFKVIQDGIKISNGRREVLFSTKTIAELASELQDFTINAPTSLNTLSEGDGYKYFRKSGEYITLHREGNYIISSDGGRIGFTLSDFQLLPKDTESQGPDVPERVRHDGRLGIDVNVDLIIEGHNTIHIADSHIERVAKTEWIDYLEDAIYINSLKEYRALEQGTKCHILITMDISFAGNYYQLNLGQGHIGPTIKNFNVSGINITISQNGSQTIIASDGLAVLQNGTNQFILKEKSNDGALSLTFEGEIGGKRGKLTVAEGGILKLI